MTPYLRLQPAGGLSVYFWLLFGTWAAASGLPKDSLLLEAEGFADRGGWVVDTRSMDVMGSPYALAHGLGVPVEDAKTTVDVPEEGSYHVWVRTRDWVAPWDAPGAPGKFQLLFGGEPLETTFGTVRVQRTTGMMGEVLGMATSICVRHETTPRGVYKQYLDELKALMRQGVGRGLLGSR